MAGRYKFKRVRGVQAATFICLDPNFHKQQVRFIQEELGFDIDDPYSQPGGPRVLVQSETREIYLKWIESVSVGHHRVEHVVLIAHRDCKAYGGSAAFKSPAEEKAAQVEDLKIARGILRERFPSFDVIMYYMEIIWEGTDGEGEVEFLPVS